MESSADAAGALFSTLFSLICCGVYGLMFLAGIVASVGWIVMLIHVIRRDESSFSDSNGKVMWILIIALTHWVGAIIYYFVEYRKVGR